MILTLVAAFGVLGLVAVLKGVTGKNGNGGGGQNPEVRPVANETAGSNNPAAPGPGSGKSVVVSDEMRAAVIAKEVEQISDLQGQADGTNNPQLIMAILDKFSNPELEVRQAALQALKEMNDTNAVPGLEKVAASLQDAREKVAVMDTIEYIKLPSVTQNVPPEYATNLVFASHSSGATNIDFNPNFVKGNKNPRGRTNPQQQIPAQAPANQPQ